MDSLFLLDEPAAEDGRFSCRARVPVATPMVEGHFPGHAIVPGIGILVLVTEVLARGLGRRVGLRAIDTARFRAQVAPGDELVVEIAAEHGRFRVSTAAGAVVANGTLRLATEGAHG